MPDVSEEKHLSQGHPWDVYSILRVTSVLARMVWAELFCIRWPLLEILGSSHRKEGRKEPSTAEQGFVQSQELERLPGLCKPTRSRLRDWSCLLNYSQKCALGALRLQGGFGLVLSCVVVFLSWRKTAGSHVLT